MSVFIIYVSVFLMHILKSCCQIYVYISVDSIVYIVLTRLVGVVLFKTLYNKPTMCNKMYTHYL